MIRNARNSADFQSCADSIKRIRDTIQNVRVQIRPIATIQDPLAEMTSACNRYLHESNRDPDRFAVLLVRLRDELHECLREIGRARRRAFDADAAPGSRAFSSQHSAGTSPRGGGVS